MSKHKTPDEMWDFLLTELGALRERGVPLTGFEIRREVIEETVSGQLSKRPAPGLICTIKFFDPVNAAGPLPEKIVPIPKAM